VFIGAMHNRVGPKVSSREIGMSDLAALVPIVLVILVFAFFPQFALTRSEPSVKSSLAAAQPLPTRVAAR
jgi:NADH:ubiquinone oxidoreductase subunit 4 (subunit M)